MRLTARVEINLRTREILAAGDWWGKDFAERMNKRVQSQAKRNVAPGKGPGPHPHRLTSPHEDTGELMASIRRRLIHRGFMWFGEVYTNLDYGFYLEMGWHSANGFFWRYPWLKPALDLARTRALEEARTTGRMYLINSGAISRIMGGSFATLFAGTEEEHGI